MPWDALFLSYFLPEPPRMRPRKLHCPDDALSPLDNFLQRTHEAQGYRRAPAVRNVVQGHRLHTVSDALQLTYAALRQWGYRFAPQGTRGRGDRPRSGRPPPVTGELARSRTPLGAHDPREHGAIHALRLRVALSQIAENRKVETRKSLTFQDPISGFYLKKATLRQSRP